MPKIRSVAIFARYLLSLVILTLLIPPSLLLAIDGPPNSEIASRLHTISSSAYTDGQTYEFLEPLLKDKLIVELGESLHMSAEFPLVRLGIVKFLHERMGFNVIAVEGSALDFWISQDELLNSPQSSSDVETAQRRSFFGLWQTQEMRELLEYEALTLKTASPLYFTSFDCQPGLRVQSIFKVLAERLSKYRNPSMPAEPAWISGLQPILDRDFPRDTEEKARVLGAIDQLDQEISTISNNVHSRFPSEAHAGLLKLLPQNLRNTVSLHEQRNHYSQVRDQLNAGFISTMHSALPEPGKLIIWAHHNHVTYGFSTSGMGNALRKQWGNQIYSIGTFAETGTYYGFLDEETPAPSSYPSPKAGTIDDYLAKLSANDYFLDLSTLREDSNQPLFRKSTIRVEGEDWSIILGKDYDAVVWIKNMHRPHFRNGMVMAFLGMDALFFINKFWYVLVIIAVLLMILIYRKVARRAAIKKARAGQR